MRRLEGPTRWWFVAALCWIVPSPTTTTARAAEAPPAEGQPVKVRLGARQLGPNRLKIDAWNPSQKGFDRQGGAFVCDNGPDAKAQRGASQTVRLDQRRPAAVVVSAWSKAEGVTGSPDLDYSLYIDLVHADGTEVYAQNAPFPTGTHDWSRVEVVIEPQKPIRELSVHVLLRRHGGKALFRDVEMRDVISPAGAAVFDGVPVARRGAPAEGFQVRDVAADGDYVRIDRAALGLTLDDRSGPAPGSPGARVHDVTIRDTTGRDRAISLVYAVPIDATAGLRWLEDPRRSQRVEPGREYTLTSRFAAGGNGRLSLYPLGGVDAAGRGRALGIDMARPAFFRVGYNAGTNELFLIYDLAFTREQPQARLRFVSFGFDGGAGFRGALEAYYALFPEAFRVRVASQGLWMPFAKISEVKGWADFGFRFKEGDNETAWDDAHNILTFRYTEPMTWWMPMNDRLPRTIEAATAEAKRLAATGHKAARSLFTSGYHDADGRLVAQFRDEPWNRGAVWSLNAMPGLAGDVTEFSHKWNPTLRRQHYPPGQAGEAGLDGEYVDSSEGYVTAELDFRRDHFAGAGTPLVFETNSRKPALFRGLIAFEYVRGIEADIRKLGKLMMANSTPGDLCWLAPLLDVAGTETDWNPPAGWRPMADDDLLYRRALCGGKPFCFLMNTDFDRWSNELTERYMRRCLAYGMFPGFFSANASDGHYFNRPELYDRDRPLFRKYVLLCKLVAEAGWQPRTGARVEGDDDLIRVERFGRGPTRYLTVYNDGPTPRRARLSLDGDLAPPASGTSRERVGGTSLRWSNRSTTLDLPAWGVALIELTP